MALFGRSATARRYMRRVGIALVVYAASLVLAGMLFKDDPAKGPLAFGLALIPGLAVVGMFYAVGMFILEQTDEFIRMVTVRQQLIAAGFAMSVAVTWGFLEMFELVVHIPAFYIMVLWAIGSLIGAVSTRITHGSWGECL